MKRPFTFLLLALLSATLTLASTADTEAAVAAELYAAAQLNHAFALGNETATATFSAFVDSQVSTHHDGIADAAEKAREQKQDAAEWTQRARDALPLAEAENALAQVAATAGDEEAAKKAREGVEDAAKACEEAAQKAFEAYEKAKDEYYSVNEAAKEADLAAQWAASARADLDLVLKESAALVELSAAADAEASPDRLKSEEVAEKVRAQKEAGAPEEPFARAAFAVVAAENATTQAAAVAWDDDSAKEAREAVEHAAKDCEESRERMQEVHKRAKKYYYELKIEQSKDREEATERIFKLRRDLKRTLDGMINEAISLAESESVLAGFDRVMRNLLHTIESRLRIRVGRKEWNDDNESGSGIEGTTGVDAGESLEELMETIFRPLPAEVDGTILDAAGKCVTTEAAFRKVYMNQIEILQRGLPTPLLRYQFSKPLSLVPVVDDVTCMPYAVVEKYFTADWHLKDTLMYGGLLSVSALQEVNGKEFPFLSFVSVPSNTLPHLGASEVSLVDADWQSTLVNKQSQIGATSVPKDVSFPRTIELLYDNSTYDACVEYRKFGPRGGEGTPDAREASVLLFAAAMRLAAMGGSKPSIAQMLANLAAFIFNGVRCKRKEGTSIRIPRALLKAYFINIARIIGEIAILGPDPKISFAAVRQVYGTEIEAMTSFDTWGNYYFHAVYPDGHYDNIAFLEAFYEDGKYDQAVALSAAARMTAGISRSLVMNATTRDDVTCGQQFEYEGSIDIQMNVYEACCARTCELLNTMAGCEDLYITCCRRCNQSSCMSSTVQDMEEMPAFSVIVPEYGQRESYAVPLMI